MFASCGRMSPAEILEVAVERGGRRGGGGKFYRVDGKRMFLAWSLLNITDKWSEVADGVIIDHWMVTRRFGTSGVAYEVVRRCTTNRESNYLVIVVEGD